VSAQDKIKEIAAPAAPPNDGTPENPWNFLEGCDSPHARLLAIADSTSAAWLERIVRWPDNPTKVFLAADARLRKVRREQRTETGNRKPETGGPAPSAGIRSPFSAFPKGRWA